MSKKKSKEEKPLELGMVLYTDGGCRSLFKSSNLPSQPVAGYGVHGYTYNSLEDPVVSAKKQDVNTNVGYLDLAKIKGNIKGVTPLEFVDMWGYVDGAQTNNTAELTAATKAITFAINSGAKETTLLMDSDYVRLGFLNHSPKWALNGWKTSTGEPVKNLEFWTEFIKMHKVAVDSGMKVTLLRVDGHSDDLGNDTADRNATKAICESRRELQGLTSDDLSNRETTVTSPVQGYWSPQANYNRMLSMPVAYIETMSPVKRDDDGKVVYYLGTWGPTKDDDQDGKRAAGHAFSVVLLDEPDPVIELVRREQDKVAVLHGKTPDLVRILLSKLFSSKVYDDLNNSPSPALYRAVSHSLNLFYMDDELVTNVARPPMLAFRSVQYLATLEALLRRYLNKDDKLVVTDITDIIYSTEEVKGKQVVKLTDQVTAPSKAMKIVVNYNTTGEVKTVPLIMTQVLDLPDRNTLSALAVRKPTVQVITYRESDIAFRWSVIIQAGGDVGIWSSVHSNLKLLMEPSK
jgi:ribonuclease HI